ncbi:MAG: MBL fold metallo-hydrolase [Gemmatimonadaceae bacterium]
MTRRHFGAAALLVVVACHATLPPADATRSPGRAMGCDAEACPDSNVVIKVTYLGVSGLLLEHGGHVLLTAPFFSNPRLGLVRPKASRLFRKSPRISADSIMIDRFLPAVADRASAILVGHGHYDHLLDVPYIATHRATSAFIYGGPSIRRMLMGDSILRRYGGRRLVPIEPATAGTAARSGIWIYTADSAYRFMALVAGHAPMLHFLGGSYSFAAGTVTTDMDSLPPTAPDWKLGEPYAYLIDVLGSGPERSVFRIYFQDAPSPPPLGFPPPDILSEGRVDLAVLCAATSSNVPHTPDSLLKVLRPAHVLVTHWESFFRSPALPPEVVPGLHFGSFLDIIRKTLDPSVPWTVAQPHETFRFPESGAPK